MHPPDYLARRIRMTTAAGLVPLLVVTSLPACATLTHRGSVRAGAAEVQSARPTPLFEWARVEAVRGGTSLTVQLHEVHARQGRQTTLGGRFYAATADTLTLTLDDGQTRTLAKSAIDTVYGPRPIWKRYAGWIIIGGVTTGFAIMGLSSDISGSAVIGPGFFYGLLASIPGFIKQRMQRIYEAPRRGSSLRSTSPSPMTRWFRATGT